MQKSDALVLLFFCCTGPVRGASWGGGSMYEGYEQELFGDDAAYDEYEAVKTFLKIYSSSSSGRRAG